MRNIELPPGTFFGAEIEPGTFHGAEIEPGTFHGAEIEPGTFHNFCPCSATTGGNSAPGAPRKVTPAANEGTVRRPPVPVPGGEPKTDNIAAVPQKLEDAAAA